MKSDMAGAAAVVQATFAIARLGLPLKVTTFAPMAENMVSGSAVRPGDVLTMYGGTTVEVLNTDAEGRLVLGDALVLATEKKPDVILDVATLTGHMVVALGDKVAGVMGSPDVVDAVLDAARIAGEEQLADADPGVHGRADPQQPDRRPVPARLDPVGRRAVRGGVPARVHRRAAVGAPRHRRAGVQLGRAVRPPHLGRHRLRGRDARRLRAARSAPDGTDGGRGGRSATVSRPREGRLEVSSSPSSFLRRL